MASITKPNTFVDGATIQASEHNANFDTIYNDYNSNITNVNISGSAAIANSKLNLAAVSQAVALAGGLTMTARQIDEAKGANVAAAAGTTTIWVTDGNFIHVTGAETITSFGTAAQAGIERTVVFDGACVLTHNATSLILPTGANITCAAGDVAIVRAETTANARVVAFLRKDGTAIAAATATNALSGSVIQTIYSESATQVEVTAVFTNDDTPPLYSEGNAIISNSITPNNASNKIRITFDAWGSISGSNVVVLFLTDATGSDPSIQTVKFTPASTGNGLCRLTKTVTAGGTSPITFYVLGAVDGGTFTISSSALFGDTSFITLTLEEIKA